MGHEKEEWNFDALMVKILLSSLEGDLSIKWHKIALYLWKIFDVVLKTNIMRKCENMTRSHIEKKEKFTK